MYESVEDLPFEDEERFEQTAMQYQEQYHKISTKYQNILLQESTVSVLNLLISYICTYINSI